MTVHRFGVAFYVDEDVEPSEITREELLALRLFGFVSFDARNRRFVNVGAARDVAAFLKEFRAGLQP